MQLFIFNDLFRLNGRDGTILESAAHEDSALSDQGIALRSARNQYVSFQAGLITDEGNLADVAVAFSGFVQSGQPDSGEAEARIAEDLLEVYTEWFHELGDVLVPDLLIPFTQQPPRLPQPQREVPGQLAGALWFDLYIPPDQRPGFYTGTLRLSADGSEQTFRLTLDISPAVVPAEPTVTFDCNNYADSLSPHFASLRDNPERYFDGSFFAIERAFVRMAREHRGLFHNLPYRHSGNITPGFAPELEGEGKTIRVKSWDRFDEHFGPYLDGSAFAGSRVSEQPIEFLYLPFNFAWPANYEKWGRKGYKTEYRRIISEFVRHFEEKGWTQTWLEIFLNHKKDYRFFPYTVDEIWYKHDEDVVDTYWDIIRGTYETSAARFLVRMDSSNYYGEHFDHRFSDMCKLWVAGFSMFNWFPESVDVMHNKDNIVWIYGGVLRSLKESLLSLFIWPVQCLMTGADGFCVWNTTGFGPDYLKAPVESGGQALFYPGSPFGLEEPLPSIRLKSLRNAMQTIDLAKRTAEVKSRPQVEALVNHAFGLESNADWWRPKPDFINTPPRYWDFNEAVGSASLPRMDLGRSPVLIHQIREGLFDLYGARQSPESDEVHFRFY